MLFDLTSIIKLRCRFQHREYGFLGNVAARMHGECGQIMLKVLSDEVETTGQWAGKGAFGSLSCLLTQTYERCENTGLLINTRRLRHWTYSAPCLLLYKANYGKDD